MFQTLKSLFYKFLNTLWLLFLNGLITILPLTITVSLFNLSFKLLQSWLKPLHAIAPRIFNTLPLSEFLLAIALIFIIGFILKIFVLRSLISAAEKLIFKIPLIRPVYSGIKQLTKAFGGHDTVSFKKIVMIEFPRKGIYSLGFMTSELSSELAPEKEKKFFSVFIPTTPNPTSGYFIIVPEESITLVPLTQQEAMALIISGGIVQPERFN